MSGLDPRVEGLLAAQAERREVDRIDPEGRLDEAEAYRLQFQGVDRRIAQGERIVGLKTGLTSRAKQETMGVRQPILGHMFASSVVPAGGSIACAELIHPRAEPEIAFRLVEDLPAGAGLSRMRAAAPLALPAIEVVDSRFRDFKFGFADVVADNTSASRVVFGEPVPVAADADLRLVGMNYLVNGEIVATAAGAAILGDPWEALAWLAKRASELGRPLTAGQTVLAGALSDAFAVKPGDAVEVRFDRLGSVGVRFV